MKRRAALVALAQQGAVDVFRCGDGCRILGAGRGVWCATAFPLGHDFGIVGRSDCGAFDLADCASSAPWFG